MTVQVRHSLILFSGLAADATVFAPQKLAFPELVVPQWLIPVDNETLGSYCERFAESIRPQTPCVIGGASFGGIIALEMARFLHPSAVLLIGSVRAPDQFPRRVRIFRPLRSTVSLLPLGLLQWSAAPVASRPARSVMPHWGGLARQFRNADRTVLRWSLRQALTWARNPEVSCPIYQIHGDRDHVLPIRGTKPDTIVAGGGHVISLTHASQVTSFIRDTLRKIDDKQNSKSKSPTL